MKPLDAVLSSRLVIVRPGQHHDALRDLAVYRREGRLAKGVRREVHFYLDGWRMRPPVDALWLPREVLLRAAQIADLHVHDARQMMPPVDLRWLGKLRPEQANIAQSIYAQGGGVLVAPPAFGKTETAMAILSAWKQPALWLVHTSPLLDGAVERAQKVLGLPRGGLGIIGGGRQDSWGSHLTVATVQSLARKRYVEEGGIGAVVLDEAHHGAALSFARVVNRLSARHRLGLTATPDRTDGLHPLIYDLFGPKAEVPYRLMVAIGRALVPHVEILPTAFVASPGADWNQMQEERALDDRRNLLICALAYREWKAGRRVIVLVERISHTTALAEFLTQRFGVPTNAVSGPVAAFARKAAFGDLSEKRSILVATKLLDEGVDIPLADCLILGAAQRSEPLLWQRIGRVIRAPEGKREATVWDLADYLVESLADQADQRMSVYRELGFPVRRHGGAVA